MRNDQRGLIGSPRRTILRPKFSRPGRANPGHLGFDQSRETSIGVAGDSPLDLLSQNLFLAGLLANEIHDRSCI